MNNSISTGTKVRHVYAFLESEEMGEAILRAGGYSRAGGYMEQKRAQTLEQIAHRRADIHEMNADYLREHLRRGTVRADRVERAKATIAELTAHAKSLRTTRK